MTSIQYATSTPLKMLYPEKIQVIPVGAGTIRPYQKQMSKAIWRPTFGKKLGFLVVHDNDLLGLIYLSTPVIRLGPRDAYLFGADKKDGFGKALEGYLDMSVCVAAQPIGWHWNLGKLMALIAPTLGDHIERSCGYPLKGITTTSVFGGNKATQYTRIYKYLGETKGSGHENVDDDTYEKMLKFLRDHCPNCNPGCADPLELTPSYTQDHDNTPKEDWCTVPRCSWRKKCCDKSGSWFSKNREKEIAHGKSLGDGSSPRMRRISAFFKAIKVLNLTPLQAIGVDVMGKEQVGITKKSALKHGHLRGVYYHPAVPASKRLEVIKQWHQRWGLPRYEKTKDQPAPYQNGTEGIGYERKQEEDAEKYYKGTELDFTGQQWDSLKK